MIRQHERKVYKGLNPDNPWEIEREWSIKRGYKTTTSKEPIEKPFIIKFFIVFIILDYTIGFGLMIYKYQAKNSEKETTCYSLPQKAIILEKDKIIEDLRQQSIHLKKEQTKYSSLQQKVIILEKERIIKILREQLINLENERKFESLRQKSIILEKDQVIENHQQQAINLEQHGIKCNLNCNCEDKKSWSFIKESIFFVISVVCGAVGACVGAGVFNWSRSYGNWRFITRNTIGAKL